MSRAVYIECQSVESMLPVGSAGSRAIAAELNMTDRQVRDAILNLLGGMPEQEAFEWLRSEHPAWFAAEVAQ